MTALLTIDRYLYKAPFHIEAIGIDLPDLADPHPNRVPWSGILTQVDEASTRPPNGSAGHRVLIPSAVAYAALPSLIGMPVDCSLGLRDHNKRLVIGVITEATLEGRNLVVRGHLLQKNFPEEVAQIQARKADLGMSYEISNVEVADVSADVWILTNLQFTGAAILLKSAAAYQHTAIAASHEEDDMAGVADEVLKTLKTIDGKLRSIQASKQDEDDEAAAKDEAAALEHETTAARHVASAKQARDDSDEEDAAKYDAEATKARESASSFRLAAAKKHEDAAAKLRAAAGADTEDAAKDEKEAAAVRHDEEAKRLKKMDDNCKEEAAAAKADTEAAKAETEAGEDEDAQAQMFARVLSAMMGKDAHAAAAKPKKEDKGDPNVHMLGMLLRAMTYMPGMMASGKAKAHDDEEQDKALIRELLRKGGDKSAMAASSPVVNMEERRRLRQMEAAMALLTDKVATLTGLLTDVVHSGRGLATDTNRGINGGPAERRSLHATTEQWVSKGEGTEDPPARRSDGKMTLKELHAALDAEGITEPADRIARQVNMQREGKVAY